MVGRGAGAVGGKWCRAPEAAAAAWHIRPSMNPVKAADNGLLTMRCRQWAVEDELPPCCLPLPSRYIL